MSEKQANIGDLFIMANGCLYEIIRKVTPGQEQMFLVCILLCGLYNIWDSVQQNHPCDTF